MNLLYYDVLSKVRHKSQWHHLRFRIDKLDEKIAAAQQFGYQSIWETRFGEGLAVAYLERPGDPLLIELFENHNG